MNTRARHKLHTPPFYLGLWNTAVEISSLRWKRVAAAPCAVLALDSRYAIRAWQDLGNSCDPSKAVTAQPEEVGLVVVH